MNKRGAESVLENPRFQGPIQPTTGNTSNIFANKSTTELQDLYAQISKDTAVLRTEKEKFVQEPLHNALRNAEAQYEIERKRAEDAERLLAEAQVKAQNLTLETEANKQRAAKAEREAMECQGRLNQIQDVRVTNPFVLVLIDGDGYIFLEDLLRKGLPGGETAAHLLRENLEKWIERDPRFQNTDAAHWRFKVRIYLNLEGLSQALYNAKLVPSLQTLRQFMTGFTQNQQLFDVVDVGHGKERTDYKIKANFENELFNSSCKYVILGCAHDNGYIPMLDPYKNNKRAGSQIMILSNKAATQQFKTLYPGPCKPFGELGLSVLQSSTVLNNTTRSPTSPKLATGLPVKTQPTPPQSPAAPPPPFQKSHYYPQPISVNQDDRRIDHPIPDPGPEIARAYKQRIHNGATKPCNDFHLTGHCRNDPCRFDHTPLSSPDEYLVLARYARNQPCHAEGFCRNEMCVFGHHCPQDAAGWCPHGSCFLARFHGLKVDKLVRCEA
ncbi:hypothetical protein G7Y79_00057g090920 [Physcia stellaris]|nr:hypothetical protein G7Y79_00057g090920 [Physcia stellaris]